MAVGFGGENILLKSTEPNFVRDVIKTYAELVSTTANHENNYDVGHIVYCEETKSHYVFLGAGYHGCEDFEGDAWRRMDHMLAFTGIENLVDHVQFSSNSDVAPIAGKFMLLNDNCLFYGMDDNTPQLISANLDSEEDLQSLVDAGVFVLTGGVVTIGGTDLYYVNHDEVLVRIANNDDIESLRNTIASKQDKLNTSTKLFTLNGTNIYFGGSATIETGGGDNIPIIGISELDAQIETGEYEVLGDGIEHDMPTDSVTEGLSCYAAGKLLVFNNDYEDIDRRISFQVLFVSLSFHTVSGSVDRSGVYIRKSTPMNQSWGSWQRLLTTEDTTGGGGSGGSDCSCNFVVVEGSDEFEDFGDWSAAVVVGEELETSGTVANEELMTSGSVNSEELIM